MFLHFVHDCVPVGTSLSFDCADRIRGDEYSENREKLQQLQTRSLARNGSIDGHPQCLHFGSYNSERCVPNNFDRKNV